MPNAITLRNRFLLTLGFPSALSSLTVLDRHMQVFFS